MTNQEYELEEQSCELKDLVTKTLEAKGLLGKIQAELRAGVFLALEESDAFRIKNPFENSMLKMFLATPDGELVVSLVREFLEHFGLEFTALVFDPEISGACGFKYSGRMETAQKMSLNPDMSGPLLSQFIERPTANRVSRTSLKSTNISGGLSQESLVDEKASEEILRLRVQEMDKLQRSLQSKSVYILPENSSINDSCTNQTTEGSKGDSKLPKQDTIVPLHDLKTKQEMNMKQQDFIEGQSIPTMEESTTVESVFPVSIPQEAKAIKEEECKTNEEVKELTDDLSSNRNITYLPSKKDGIKPFRVDLNQLNHLLDFNADGGEGFDDYEEELAVSSALSSGEKSIVEELQNMAAARSTSSSSSSQKSPKGAPNKPKCSLLDIEEYLKNVSKYLGNTDAIQETRKEAPALKKTPEKSPENSELSISPVSSISKDNTTISTDTAFYDNKEDILSN